MTYVLYHKNIPVLSFKMEEDEITDVLEIFNKEHLPLGVFKDYEKGVSAKKQFRSWWQKRAIPASRENLRDALELLGNVTTGELVAKSFGLSLSDQYWAKSESSNLEWKDINFFQNDFSEDVGKALFGTLDVHDFSCISLISPDNTSDGWLKKKWIIDNGERILLKGGSGTEQQESFNEVLVSEICSRLGIPHVEYAIIESEKRYYSSCNDFITTETELVSALHIKNVLQKEKGVSEYNHLLKCCESCGMKDLASVEKSICEMIVVDYIVANIDRHFNNFGFVRNAETLEWMGLAPIFDTGTSMFHNFSVYDLQDEHLLKEAASKPFARTHSEQIEKLLCRKYCASLPFQKLNGIELWFDDLLRKNKSLSSQRREILCSILKQRIFESQNILNSATL